MLHVKICDTCLLSINHYILLCGHCSLLNLTMYKEQAGRKIASVSFFLSIIAYANSKQQHQPVHLCSLKGAFIVRLQNNCKDIDEKKKSLIRLPICKGLVSYRGSYLTSCLMTRQQLRAILSRRPEKERKRNRKAR